MEKNMKKLFLVLIIILCCISVLFAIDKEKGPFGTTWLSSESDLRKVGTLTLYKDNGDYSTYIFSPNKGHSAFDSYMVLLLKDVGLVKVVAGGKNIKCTGYGTELKSAYESMRESLIKTYGSVSGEENYNSSSVWSEPADWMYSLYMGHRKLESFWQTGTVFILLEAVAENSNSGYIILAYEHKKWGEYLESEADVL